MHGRGEVAVLVATQRALFGPATLDTDAALSLHVEREAVGVSTIARQLQLAARLQRRCRAFGDCAGRRGDLEGAQRAGLLLSRRLVAQAILDGGDALGRRIAASSQKDDSDKYEGARYPEACSNL